MSISLSSIVHLPVRWFLGSDVVVIYRESRCMVKMKSVQFATPVRAPKAHYSALRVVADRHRTQASDRQGERVQVEREFNGNSLSAVLHSGAELVGHVPIPHNVFGIYIESCAFDNVAL